MKIDLGERHDPGEPSHEYEQFVRKYSKELFARIVANKNTWINPDYRGKLRTIVAYISDWQLALATNPETKLEDVQDQQEWLEWFKGITRGMYPDVQSIRDLRGTHIGSYTEYLRLNIRMLQQIPEHAIKFEGQNTNVKLGDVINDINREAVQRLDEITSELLDILYQDKVTKEDVEKANVLMKEALQLTPTH